MASLKRSPAGIDEIDMAWGGLYEGSSYLVVGPSGGSQRLVALAFVRAGSIREAQCLIISAGRPRRLLLQAGAIGYDLTGAHEEGHVRILKTPPELDAATDDDAVLQAFRDVGSLVAKQRPQRLVIDGFGAFLRVKDRVRFEHTLGQLLERIESLGTTALLVLDDPLPDTPAAGLVETLRTQMAGTIRLAAPTPTDPGHLTLLPGLGHLERERFSPWAPTSLVPDTRRDGPPPERASWTPGAVGDGGATPDARPSIKPSAPPRAEKPRRVKPFEPERIERPGDDGAPFSPAPPRADGQAPRPTGTPPQWTSLGPGDPDKPAARGPAQHAPALLRPAEDEPEPERLTDRDAFLGLLAESFAQRRHHGTPFLLLALRLDNDDPVEGRSDFRLMLHLAGTLLTPSDALLADARRRRVLVLLSGRGEEAAQQLFARMKKQMQGHEPERARRILNAVAANVLPNGEPFDDPAAALAFAMDEG